MRNIQQSRGRSFAQRRSVQARLQVLALEDRLPMGEAFLGVMLSSFLGSQLAAATFAAESPEEPGVVQEPAADQALPRWTVGEFPPLPPAVYADPEGGSGETLASRLPTPTLAGVGDNDLEADLFQAIWTFPGRTVSQHPDSDTLPNQPISGTAVAGGSASQGLDRGGAKATPNPGRGAVRADTQLLSAASLLQPAAQSVAQSGPATDTAPRPGSPSQSAAGAFGRLPFDFEANRGQTDQQYQFIGRGPGYTLYSSAAEAVLVFPRSGAADAASPDSGSPVAEPTVVRMRLLGANSDAPAAGLDPEPGRSNYLRGSDPSRWVTDVPHYGRVAYQGVYPGVDMVYYGNQSQLEYDFVVSPGADPHGIRLSFEGAQGLGLDDHGSLVVATPGGNLIEHAPVLYQEIDGARLPVTGRFVVEGAQVGFEAAAYDPTRPLVIDPQITWSTYLGGSLADEAHGIAVDSAGSAYIGGIATSLDFPTQDGYQGTYGGGDDDAFVAKFTPDGSALVYSTYLGGSRADEAYSIAVDAAGDAYITGRTATHDTDAVPFPIANALYPTFRGGADDAFVAELNPSGNGLVYSTYLGGGSSSSPEWGTSISVTPEGAAYVTGLTNCTDFPHIIGDPYGGGVKDAFVTAFAPGGSSLIYSRFLGGSGDDRGFGIAVDPNGNAYVTGSTTSDNFPLLNPIYSSRAGGTDAFLTELAPDGSLLYSTYLGGSGTDVGMAVAVDAAGCAYVTGWTTSGDFPIVNAVFGSPAGGIDAFVAKVDPGDTALAYSTYLGGSGDDVGTAIAVDPISNAYVTGSTTSGDFPTLDPVQSAYAGGTDGFVTELSPLGDELLFSSYLGGSAFDDLLGIAVPDDSGMVYLAGKSSSTDYPVLQAVQGSLRGVRNAVVTALEVLQTRVVDVIPTSLSDEANQDSERSLAMAATTDPNRPVAAITTFSRVDGRLWNFMNGAWGEGGPAPTWLSQNGGRSWNVRANIPRPGGDTGPYDQTLAYVPDGSRLYGAFLGNTTNNTFYMLYNNPNGSDFSEGASLTSMARPDQPWIQVARVGGQNRVYVGFNDRGNDPRSASVVVSPMTDAPFQDRVPIDQGAVMGRDQASVRVAVQGDRVYAAFGRRTGAPGPTTVPGSIVVVRDDNGGIASAANPNPFRALGLTGTTVEAGTLPLPTFMLGQESLGSDLSIAIDPTDATGRTVYVAYAVINAGTPEIHIQKSVNGGVAWAATGPVITNAALPALAVAANGNLGLLYTRLAAGNMRTEFYQQTAAGMGGRTATLAVWPQMIPMRTFRPYIGDYQMLLSIGNTFYGAFSASNDPKRSHFPRGVFYQRDINLNGTVVNNSHLTVDGTLDDGTGPPPAVGGNPGVSIDPFFFSIPSLAFNP
jgi:hypothetical protein